MPPVEVSPFNLDVVRYSAASSSRSSAKILSPSGKVLYVFSSKVIVGRDLQAAFAARGFKPTNVLKKQPHAALVFFEDDLVANKALNSEIEYNDEILKISVANFKKTVTR
jgi:hypothetical protein